MNVAELMSKSKAAFGRIHQCILAMLRCNTDTHVDK